MSKDSSARYYQPPPSPPKKNQQNKTRKDFKKDFQRVSRSF